MWSVSCLIYLNHTYMFVKKQSLRYTTPPPLMGRLCMTFCAGIQISLCTIMTNSILLWFVFSMDHYQNWTIFVFGTWVLPSQGDEGEPIGRISVKKSSRLQQHLLHNIINNNFIFRPACLSLVSFVMIIIKHLKENISIKWVRGKNNSLKVKKI